MHRHTCMQRNDLASPLESQPSLQSSILCVCTSFVPVLVGDAACMTRCVVVHSQNKITEASLQESTSDVWLSKIKIFESQLDRLMWFINLDKNHWVMVCVRLDLGTIEIGNSGREKLKNQDKKEGAVFKAISAWLERVRTQWVLSPAPFTHRCDPGDTEESQWTSVLHVPSRAPATVRVSVGPHICQQQVCM